MPVNMCKVVVVILTNVIFVCFASALQISNGIPNSPEENFKVYWNSPTFQCKSHKIYFDDVLDKYSIRHNKNVDFRGEEITILYDPGMFPALLNNGSQLVFRNGGIPQDGNISLHYNYFRDSVEELIPDKNFRGIGVIDFESWRPIFRQNFGTLLPYKNLSIQSERDRHPLWPESLVQKEAMRRFEYAGRKFMEQTIIWASELRPNATWGYYAYPYCFNMSPSNMNANCSMEVKKENDRLHWLFNASHNLHPSLYVSENRLTVAEKIQLVEGRLDESHRISALFNNTKNIYPYFWYNYQDTKNFLVQEDLKYMIFVLKALKINGFIIWGSSNDVNTREKCENLYNYINDILGPTLLQHIEIYDSGNM